MSEITGPRGGTGAMFDEIAHRYDLLNRVMSFGVDQGWRRRTVDALALAPGDRVLDVATGTGDLAFEILRRHPSLEVVGVDPSPRMLAVARAKADREALGARFAAELGDARALPFADGAFAASCIGFGIRNVPDRPLALRELARVTRPGGRVAVLELSEPRGGLLGPLARFHIRTVVPRLGAFLSGARQYRYLQQSIAAFPPPNEFAAVIAGAGLELLRAEELTFGVCCLFVAAPRGTAP